MKQAEHGAPVLACCGFSGSGKTTLIEALVPVLRARGLLVAVVKHDAHGVQFDRPGKDSDRLFCAGASVLLRGANESAARWHPEDAPSLNESLSHLGANHDLVLVEGHKQTDLPKLWLLADGEDEPPPEVTGILGVLARGEERPGIALGLINSFLDGEWRAKRVEAAILVGGQSTRMGSPKQLVDHGGMTLIQRAAEGLGGSQQDPVLLGSGRVPGDLAGNRRLADVSGVPGPLGGLLAALRWAPGRTWLVVACDQPSITVDAVDWLMAQRRPGCWAVLPRLGDGPVEPFLAIYEPQARALLERLARSGARGPWRIAGHEKVATPRPPAEIAACWTNVNTPEDLDNLSG